MVAGWIVCWATDDRWTEFLLGDWWQPPSGLRVYRIAADENIVPDTNTKNLGGAEKSLAFSPEQVAVCIVLNSFLSCEPISAVNMYPLRGLQGHKVH